MSRYFTRFVCFLSLFTLSLHAMDETPIIVTADRLETAQDRSGSSTTILTKEDIENAHTSELYELLESLPGLVVSNSGGVGRKTSIFLRGNRSENVLVLLNGLPMTDPTAASFDFGQLDLQSVKRIEILKGSQSVLYGPNAIGGVINVITDDQYKSKHQSQATLGYGRYKTSLGSFRHRSKSGMFVYQLAAQHRRSEGFSTADAKLITNGAAEKDGHQITTSHLQAKINFTKNRSLSFMNRNTFSKTEDDSFGKDDPNSEYKVRSLYSNLVFRDLLFSDQVETKLSFNFNHSTRKLQNPIDTANRSFDFSRFYGQLFQLSWQNNIFITDTHTTIVGLDYQKERGTFNLLSTYLTEYSKAQSDTKGPYLYHKYEGQTFFASVGGRYDHHKAYGRQLSFKVNPGFTLRPTNTTFALNFSSGYKSPTLEQLYVKSYVRANSKLTPEKSLNYEFIVKQKFGKRAYLQLSLFLNRIKNYITGVRVGNAYVYENSYRADFRGIELEGHLKLAKGLILKSQFTRLLTKDHKTGTSFKRRPRKTFSLDLLYKRGNMKSKLTWFTKGRRDDISTTYKTITLPSYSLLHASVSYRWSKQIESWAKLKNILNKKYNDIAGYGTAGRSYMVGLTARF